MTPTQRLAIELDPSLLFPLVGLEPDPWQTEFMRGTARRQSLLCCRQSGKSTAAGLKGLHTAITVEEAPVLLVSPSLRQSGEIFGKVAKYYRQLGRPVRPVYETRLSVELENGSRIISLPGNPDTIVGFSGVKLAIVDEAARVADPVFMAVSPMLAVSGGAIVTLSTPKGQRGFFHREWQRKPSTWHKIKITADDCPRIPREFLDDERATMGDYFYKQEYFCEFNEDVTQYYRTEDILGALSDGEPPIFTSDELQALYTEPTAKPLFGSRKSA
jgi:hypothetical protein